MWLVVSRPDDPLHADPVRLRQIVDRFWRADSPAAGSGCPSPQAGRG